MIDEKKLDKEIVAFCKGKIDGGYYKMDTVDACVEVRHIIEEQPKVGEWTPVSEKLPENIKTVLVTIKELEQPILGWYGNKFGWRIVMPEFVNIKDYTVIAWMPLPEPYKEGE